MLWATVADPHWDSVLYMLNLFGSHNMTIGQKGGAQVYILKMNRPVCVGMSISPTLVIFCIDSYP